MKTCYYYPYSDHDQDHVTIVVNIATDHHLLTAVDHHLHTKENVDPDHNHAEQSLQLSKISIFLLCARPATFLLVCSHISAT